MSKHIRPTLSLDIWWCRVSCNHEVHLWAVSKSWAAKLVWLQSRWEGACGAMAGGGKPWTSSLAEEHLLPVHGPCVHWKEGGPQDHRRWDREARQGVGCVRSAPRETQVLGRGFPEHCGSITPASVLRSLHHLQAPRGAADTQTFFGVVERNLSSPGMAQGCWECSSNIWCLAEECGVMHEY